MSPAKVDTLAASPSSRLRRWSSGRANGNDENASDDGAPESEQGWSECVGLRVLAPGEVTGAGERAGDTEPGRLADVEAAGELGQ